ncbi:MAG: ATP-binding protein [bacterium]|nr:ATP-binding protein [bacterium]
MNPYENYFRIFDCMAEAVLIRDKNFAIRYCNPAGGELFEQPHPALVNRQCQELFGENCPRCNSNCPIDKSLSIPTDRSALVQERQVTLANGTKRILRFRDCFQLPGSQDLAVMLIDDVTPQKQLLSEYEKSEQRFRSMFEESPLSLWEEDGSDVKKYVDELRKQGVVDFHSFFNDNPSEAIACLSKLKILRVNQATLTLYEASTQKELVDRLPETFTPIAFSLYANGTADLAQGKRQFEQDTEVKTLTGISRYIHTKVLIPSGYENSWQRIIVSSVDITERQRILEKLRESEEKFAFAFRQNPNPLILVTYPERTILDANQALCDIIGLCRDELLGRSYSEIAQFENPDDLLHIRAINDSGATLHNYEITFCNAIGEKHTGLLSAEHLVLNGKDCFLAQFIDLSHRIIAEGEREALRERMRYLQKIESLGMLAGGVAHDFNNLLGGILGFVELALIKSPEDSTIVDYLHKIENACKRATVLSKQMLEFSGRGKFTLKPESLTKIIDNAKTLLSSMTPSNVRIEYDLTSELPEIECDQNQILQIITNLLTNSIEAIGTSSGVVKIASGQQHLSSSFIKSSFLSAEISEGSFVFIDVTDNGCGMNVETVSRIFDPFFSTKFTGRGLGLPSALGIVRGHRGAIRVVSNPGKGTSIRVYLPEPVLKIDNANYITAHEKPDMASRNAVLIIDDEESIRNVVCRALDISKIDTLCAASGEEGIELYKQHRDRIHLILLDLTMPGMSGEQTMDELLKLRGDLRIIVSSGFPQQTIVQRFTVNKPFAYLQKPFRIGDLLIAVKSALSR